MNLFWFLREIVLTAKKKQWELIIVITIALTAEPFSVANVMRRIQMDREIMYFVQAVIKNCFFRETLKRTEPEYFTPVF